MPQIDRLLVLQDFSPIVADDENPVQRRFHQGFKEGRLAAKFLLCLAAFRNIGQTANGTDNRAVLIAHRSEGTLANHLGAVGQGVFMDEWLRPAGQAIGDEALLFHADFNRHHFLEMPPLDLGKRLAKEGADQIIRENHLPVFVDAGDVHRQGVDHGAQESLFSTQGFFRPFAGPDFDRERAVCRCQFSRPQPDFGVQQVIGGLELALLLFTPLGQPAIEETDAACPKQRANGKEPRRLEKGRRQFNLKSIARCVPEAIGIASLNAKGVFAGFQISKDRAAAVGVHPLLIEASQLIAQLHSLRGDVA